MAIYLITGIGGFIGSSLARELLKQGAKVRGIDNFSTGKRENLQEILGQVDFREADMLDLDAVHAACRGVDYVLHQAAIPSVPKSVLDPSGSNRANVDGTVNVLVAARDARVKRLVYAASSSAYGDTPNASQARAHDARPHFAVRRRQAGQRALSDFFLPLLWTGDSGLALLQHLWTTAGSYLAILGRAGEVHYSDAGWYTAHHLRRWRAEP